MVVEDIAIVPGDLALDSLVGQTRHSVANDLTPLLRFFGAAVAQPLRWAPPRVIMLWRNTACLMKVLCWLIYVNDVKLILHEQY